MSISTLELRTYANAYIEATAPDVRCRIIHTVHSLGGQPALEALAVLTGINRQHLIIYAKTYYSEKRRWRRKYGSHRQFCYWVDPPKPVSAKVDEKTEVAELAEILVGENGGEWREGRRNTFAKTMNSKARKQR